MKSVVITGSARGLGFCMARLFREYGYNVVISDLNYKKLEESKEELLKVKGKGNVECCVCDVTDSNSIKKLIDFSIGKFKVIDIWINNAGVNQPDKPIWDLTEKEIDLVLNVDLKGAIMGSKLVFNEMANAKKGAIYNVEGHGSNDVIIPGLSMYGTSKRAITYFTQALAKEAEEKRTGVIVGRLSPGIMITNFITNALGDKEKICLDDKTKRVYNILGDYPEVVAEFLVSKMITNTKNNVHIEWLTNMKASIRFMKALFCKRNFFD